MNDKPLDRQLEFHKSIIDGVEIKRCRNTPHAYKPHVHKELSLGYIVEGSTDLSLNENMVQYRLGDGVIIPPLMTHRCAPKDIDHWAYIMLYIDPVYYEDAVEFKSAKKLTGSKAKKLIGFIEQLMEETDAAMLESILVELLLEFGQQKKTNEVDQTDDMQRVSTQPIVLRTIEDIHDDIRQHVETDMSLNALQDKYNMNKFSIIRHFKKQYATTPAAFHLQCKVAEAKRQLSDGVSVMDVCVHLGFYDQAHFIKEFKKMHGTTPTAYVEQLNK